MAIERSDFRRNVIDLLDRALARGVVVDAGLPFPTSRTSWPDADPVPSCAATPDDPAAFPLAPAAPSAVASAARVAPASPLAPAASLVPDGSPHRVAASEAAEALRRRMLQAFERSAATLRFRPRIRPPVPPPDEE